MKTWARLAIVMCLSLPACHRSEATGCVPGSTVACDCPAGVAGVQRCLDGRVLGRCNCPQAAPPVTFDQARPLPLVLPPPPLPPTPPPTSVTFIHPGRSSYVTPLDHARACLRSNPGDMAAGNECVVQALHGRASSEPELALLAVTYRTMGHRADAMRTMRAYNQRFPEGARVASFRQYIANNAP